MSHFREVARSSYELVLDQDSLLVLFGDVSLFHLPYLVIVSMSALRVGSETYPVFFSITESFR